MLITVPVFSILFEHFVKIDEESDREKMDYSERLNKEREK